MRDLPRLKQEGITHIVNCASPVMKDGREILESIWVSVKLDATHYREIGITESNYLGLPILDTNKFDISQFFEGATRFIDSAINPSDIPSDRQRQATAEAEATSSGKVVVHCSAGINRSPTIVIAYLLMRKHNRFRSLEEAVRFVRSLREISPCDGFLEQLIKLERRLSTSN